MNTNNSAPRNRKSLQVLPLACLAALSVVTADVHASAVTSDKYVVPIGSAFELTVTESQVAPNGSAVAQFFRFDVSAPSDFLISQVNVPNTGTGTNFAVESPSIVADTSLFVSGQRCHDFYAQLVVNGQDLYLSNLIEICLQYQSATDAKTVNRVLPTFRATVAAVAPGTEAPTGTVDFYACGNLICSDAVDSAGEASCSTLHHLISLCPNYTAKYSGDGVYQASEDLGSFSL